MFIRFLFCFSGIPCSGCCRTDVPSELVVLEILCQISPRANFTCVTLQPTCVLHTPLGDTRHAGSLCIFFLVIPVLCSGFSSALAARFKAPHSQPQVRCTAMGAELLDPRHSNGTKICEQCSTQLSSVPSEGHRHGWQNSGRLQESGPTSKESRGDAPSHRV